MYCRADVPFQDILIALKPIKCDRILYDHMKCEPDKYMSLICEHATISITDIKNNMWMKHY
jgi:hypothetical protein